MTRWASRIFPGPGSTTKVFIVSCNQINQTLHISQNRLQAFTGSYLSCCARKRMGSSCKSFLILSLYPYKTMIGHWGSHHNFYILTLAKRMKQGVFMQKVFRNNTTFSPFLFPSQFVPHEFYSQAGLAILQLHRESVFRFITFG